MMHAFIRRLLLLLAGMLAFSAYAAEKDAFYWNRQIGRGINLGNMLEAPKRRAKFNKIDERHFDRIKDAGFDSIRIPVRWSDYMGEQPSFAIDPDFQKRVDALVNCALERDFVVILNVHHYTELMDEPDTHYRTFLMLWMQLATHYKNYPERLYFEVLNEPVKGLTSERWNLLQHQAVDVIRKSNPDRPILIAPTGWNRIAKLKELDLPDVKNLIASVHFYEPFKFTHQGASWVKMDLPIGKIWEGNEHDRAEIEADFKEAVRWSEEQGIPINVGEFGAYGKGNMQSRIRWTKFVREQAEKNGMSWNYWEFNSGFGLYDPKLDQWRDDLLQALISN